MADIADRIRAERVTRSWSQDELARRAGISTAVVKRLESGNCVFLRFMQVCHALGVTAGYILSDEWSLPSQPLSLTGRQAQVLRAVSDGRPLSEAARELGMPRDGLASRMTQIYRRLGVADLPRSERRAAAVRVAVNHGLIDAA